MTRNDIEIMLWPARAGGKWRTFSHPVEVIEARSIDKVVPALQLAETAAARGLYAVGFITYEAARAFDPACVTHTKSNLPLLWFGLFRKRREIELGDLYGSPDGFDVTGWRPSMPRKKYHDAINRIKLHLRKGDTYQVNYTMRLLSRFKGNPANLFLSLARSTRAGYCAFIRTPSFSVCSASPELFFRLNGRRLVSRPMKGTSKRGLTAKEDRDLAAALHQSEKNRAENVMIVDMIRNDMGRIADHGTVKMTRSFDIEQYPTLYQMTSTVECRTRVNVSGVMAALFPCASITGAPKIRTMELIRELEPRPRGIYTGAIGIIEPGRRAEFSVAIRTVMFDTKHRRAEYGVGGGIVWDSKPKDEYGECMVKAGVLTANATEFELLETILWEKPQGFYLLRLHLLRMAESARYFDCKFEHKTIAQRLKREALPAVKSGCRRFRVRLLLSRSGLMATQWIPLDGDAAATSAWKVALAKEPVDQANPYLYHKTTNRIVYEQARRAKPDCDEVILWNRDGRITEGTFTNIVVEKQGKLITPPVSCGLLPGIYRAHLLSKGRIEEGVLTTADLRRAKRIFMINSVRKWIPATLDTPT